MWNTKKKLLLFGLIAISTAGSAVVYFLDRNHKIQNGYCFAEKRYFSDQEYIDLAVGKLLKIIQNPVHSKNIKGSYTLIQYTSLQDFYAQNPDCCSKEPGSGKGTFTIPQDDPTSPNYEWQDHYIDTSFVRGEINFKHIANNPTPNRALSFSMNRCGQQVIVNSVGLSVREED